MKKLFTGFCFFFLCLAFNSKAQTGTVRKHFIYFRDKANSPYSVNQPAAYLSPAALARRSRQQITVKSRDLPVNPAYVNGIKATGAPVLYRSKWFNGVLVSCDSAKLAQLQALPFVKNAVTTNKSKPKTLPDKLETQPSGQRIAASRADYGIAYRQAQMIGATQMHDSGFRGEGMTIAVFDAGFPGVNTASPFNHLYTNNQIKGVYDFVDRDNTVYEKSSHGTMTLSCIGAMQTGAYIGTAPNANFYLFITENDNSEHPVEEYNWLFAAEYADSVGVDIISSSLGYTEFDYPSLSYTYASLNGNFAVSTKAADFAAATGILVVNSAGNEGNSAWHYIGAPADGDSVLAVGAVDSTGIKVGFSSFGPNSAGLIKPNLAAQGALSAVVLPNGVVSRNNGTSFSCPIMAGLVAGFWQANPQLTNMQVINFLQRSGSLANNPNNNLGYGIPNFAVAQQMANPTGIVAYPNPSADEQISLAFPNNFSKDPIQIKVFDRTGRMVQDFTVPKLNSQRTAELPFRPGLTSGIYILHIMQGDQSKFIRFMKL
jgi:serine protease AprX